jgi:response regulator NasT
MTKFRVIVADDESIIRLDLVEILTAGGYEVVGEAANGEDALALIRDIEPDLALLDVKMPLLDGIAVAREARESATKVVILTAFSQRGLIDEAKDAGVSAYLVKPFRASEILPTLAEVMVPGSSEYVVPREAMEDKIETREIVQLAKERLMADAGLEEPAAFERIQRTAMRDRVRMRDIAEMVLRGERIDED